MISRLYTTIAVAVLFFVVSSTAYAQFEATDRSRLGIRMSDYRPSSSKLSSLSGNWMSPIIDVNLRFDNQDRPTHVISLSWYGQEAASRRAKYIPMTYNYIRHYSKSEEGDGWYTGVGLGLYMHSFEAYDSDSAHYGQNAGWKSTKTNSIGLSLTAGYEFSQAWFAEARYDMAGGVANPVVGDVHFGGLLISFGTRLGY